MLLLITGVAAIAQDNSVFEPTATNKTAARSGFCFYQIVQNLLVGCDVNTFFSAVESENRARPACFKE